MPESDRTMLAGFADPAAISRYHEGMRRYVPAADALHRMAGILLAETAGENARILVVGAGGGAELAALASAQPTWRFTGVDPAPAMLDLARATLGPDAGRAELIEGYVDRAPDGPFDGAVSLLTLHFLDRAERGRTVREIHRRLRPGARFVAAHASLPLDEPGRSRWLSRYAAFAVASGADPVEADTRRAGVAAHLNMLDPETDAAILTEAGFAGVEQFYGAFTWRGWVGTA